MKLVMGVFFIFSLMGMGNILLSDTIGIRKQLECDEECIKGFWYKNIELLAPEPV